jgi:tyrosinase
MVEDITPSRLCLFPILEKILTSYRGDPGGDFYVSPADPAFYLHHGQIDRLWTIWQMQDSTRQYAIAGTNTVNNYPPSANTQLTDVMNAGYAGGPNVTVHDVLSTVKGSFCFIYDRSPSS